MPTTCQRPAPSLTGDPRHYAADESAPGHARLHTHAQLGAWGLGELADDMAVIVSELVTNAVLHGSRGEGDQVALRLRSTGHGVVAEVWDGNPAPPELRGADPLAEHGKGLRLVDSLSSRWDWYPSEGGGKVVWASTTTEEN